MMSLILLSFLCLSRKTNLLPISYCRDDPTSSTKDWFNDILVTMCKKQYLEVVIGHVLKYLFTTITKNSFSNLLNVPNSIIFGQYAAGCKNAIPYQQNVTKFIQKLA